MPTILDKIVATKRTEIATAKQAVSEEALRQRLTDAPPARDFFAALSVAESVGLIAEVKKASPSKGVIREDFHPVEIARVYERHGAHCISVLTDETYFQGHLDFLTQIRAAVGVPLLRKDFILDAYQLVEARVAGADAVLLIAECLDDRQLRSLHDEAIQLGMTPLVEPVPNLSVSTTATCARSRSIWPTRFVCVSNCRLMCWSSARVVFTPEPTSSSWLPAVWERS